MAVPKYRFTVLRAPRGKLRHATVRYGRGVNRTACGRACGGWRVADVDTPDCRRCLRALGVRR